MNITCVSILVILLAITVPLRADSDYQATVDVLTNAREFAESAQIQTEAGDVARSNVLRSQI